MTKQNIDIAWCPGCGNFAIRQILIKAINELFLDDTKNIVVVSGIGQAAKMPQYLPYHFFNGLHGRALPVAFGIKSANPNLKVIVVGGDGDMYGEGGNHFLHAIRRNIDIVHIVHNNQIYGLTKGQASPTTIKGTKTTLQRDGVILDALNPISLAVSQDASFVARCYSGHIEKSVKIVKKAFQHKGYSLIDMLQPCVTYNKINTHSWYEKNTDYIEANYDTNSRTSAFRKSIDELLWLGIFYQKDKECYTDRVSIFKNSKTPLYLRNRDFDDLYDRITNDDI